MNTEQPTKPDILHTGEHEPPEIKPHTEAKEQPAPPKSPAKTTDEEPSPKAQSIQEPSQLKQPPDKSDMEIELLAIQNPPQQTRAEEQITPQKPLHHFVHPSSPEEKPHTEPEKAEMSQVKEEKEMAEEPKKTERPESEILHEGEEIQGPDGTKFRIEKVNIKNTEASQVHCISCNRNIQKKSIKSHITTKTHKMHVQ